MMNNPWYISGAAICAADEQIAKQDNSERVTYFAQVEAKLITSPDPIFRFHSGAPSASKVIVLL